MGVRPNRLSRPRFLYLTPNKKEYEMTRTELIQEMQMCSDIGDTGRGHIKINEPLE